MTEIQKFHWADYLVFSLSLVMSLAIGVYISFRDRHRSNTEEFLMDGRSMNFLAVAFSIAASLLNGVFIIGLPTEIYYYGPVFSLYIIASFFLVLTVSFIFIPTFHRMQITSAYEVRVEQNKLCSSPALEVPRSKRLVLVRLTSKQSIRY